MVLTKFQVNLIKSVGGVVKVHIEGVGAVTYGWANGKEVLVCRLGWLFADAGLGSGTRTNHSPSDEHWSTRSGSITWGSSVEGQSTTQSILLFSSEWWTCFTWWGEFTGAKVYTDLPTAGALNTLYSQQQQRHPSTATMIDSAGLKGSLH